MRHDTKRTLGRSSAAAADFEDLLLEDDDATRTTDLGESALGISSDPPPERGSPPDGWRRGPFDHDRLEAYSVSREALVLGDSVAQRLPADHATLAHELRRSLLCSQLGVAHGASRGGRDRAERFHVARAEVARAASALDAATALGLVQACDVEPVLELLGRLSAMLVRLAAKVDGAR